MMPVKSPPVTSRVAVPVLVKVESPVRFPVTLKSPVPWLTIAPLKVPAALMTPSLTAPPFTTLVVLSVAP